MSEWISVRDRLTEAEQEIMLCCKMPRNGYTYCCLGFYVPHGLYTEDSDFTWDFELCEEYDEDRDDYLVKEGWYERIKNWDDFGCVAIDDTVTHWMPLPKPPSHMGGK